VLGVDGCKDGWAVVALEDGRFVDAWVTADFSPVVDDVAAFIAVDIPLGETTPGNRAADAAAKEFLGKGQKAKVFTPPPLAAEAATSFDEACAIAVRLTGKKITQQAWRLLPKMLEVSAHWASDARIREVHPECSFRAMQGSALTHGKKTWGGAWQRIAALQRQGIEVPTTSKGIGNIATDDVLDAAGAAWTAHRVATGIATSLPDPPERDAQGRPVAVWC
jgi:predicted RNase H-like nuclease